MAKRTSAADRRRDALNEERDAFRAFCEGLDQLDSLAAIHAAVNTPERFGPNIEGFLSNLGYFLGYNFAVPGSATRKELGLYERLIERLGGALPQRDQIIARLQEARQEPSRRL